MKMALLIGGAKYIDHNHPEFQQVWWNAREGYNYIFPVLLVQIAECSPGAFNKNSRFIRKLLYQGDKKN